MVDVAQLVEPRIVIPAVAGSSPVVHPTFAGCESSSALLGKVLGPLAQLVEQLTLNQLVVGSIPTRPTKFKTNLLKINKKGTEHCGGANRTCTGEMETPRCAISRRQTLVGGNFQLALPITSKAAQYSGSGWAARVFIWASRSASRMPCESSSR
jgi:hypothetical protein